MTGALVNIFKVPELRRKIWITVALLAVYRIGYQIPLPGVNYEVLRSMVDRAQDRLSSFVGLFNALSGGSLEECVLFSLGVLPYISSSIIFSLLVKVIPALEKLSKEGAAGQRKINQYSRLLTVPLCVVQAIVVCFASFKRVPPYEGQHLVPDMHGTFGQAFLFVTMATVGMTAGTIFLMWIGEQITEHGIGNGISLLIMAGILGRVPNAVWSMVEEASKNRALILTSATVILVYVAVVVAVVYITKGQRRIPIQQAKQARGGRMYGGAKHFLPIKVNQANVMPVIFASSLLVLPQTIASAVGGGQGRFLTPGTWWHAVLYIGLIFFFSYFWNSLIFQPAEIANNLKDYGSFIPGIRPGRQTAEFLDKVLTRITLVGAAFLAAIAVIPELTVEVLGVNWLVASFLGGTGILIVVGVALDVVDKLNSHLLMRNYEGFMSASSSRRGR